MLSISAVERTTHGMSKTSEHRCWLEMQQRCYNDKREDYHRYGGRGIVVCDGWLKSFDNFYVDMGRKPSPEHSIDRRDVNGNYEPSNCRWATVHEQSRNKRGNRLLTFGNETKCLTDWAHIIGIDRRTLAARIDKLGWSIDRALATRDDDRRNR